MRTLVVIPSKDLEKKVGSVVRAVHNVDSSLDVLVVDDGSEDDTAGVARAAGASVLSHDTNRGKGAALQTGFRNAAENGYDAIITMDGDGQHDPREIPKFIKALASGDADIIIGTRMSAVGDMPAIRVWTNRTTSRVVSRLAGQEIDDSQSGYRILKTDVVRGMTLVTCRYDTESEILIRAGRRGFRIGSMPIESIYDEDGVSYINPFVDTLRFVRLVIRSLFWR